MSSRRSFRIHPSGECGRTNEVREHHRDLPALGGVLGLRLCFDPGSFTCYRGGAGQLADGREHFAPMSKRDAKLFEVLIGQITQYRDIDVVFDKALGVLGQAELFEPVRDLPHRVPYGSLKADQRLPQAIFDAIVAPSARVRSFAHMMLRWTRPASGLCENQQSVPAMTFSRPAQSAKRMSRSATSSGCSTMLVECAIRPGISTLPGGSRTSFHIRHSCSCRGFAASKLKAPVFTSSTRSTMSLSGTSNMCGPFQLPQQM